MESQLPIGVGHNRRLSNAQVRKKMETIWSEWLVRKEAQLGEAFLLEKKLYARAEHVFSEYVPSWLMWYSDAPTLSDGSYWAFVHPPEMGTLAVVVSSDDVTKTISDAKFVPTLDWYYFDGESFEKSEDMVGAIGRLYHFNPPAITEGQVKIFKFGPF